MPQWIVQIVEVVNNLMEGKHNATGTLTLTASVTSTTLTDRLIGSNTRVHLTPTTATAAIATANTYQTFPNATKGQAVFTHANTADVDKTFAYSLHG